MKNTRIKQFGISFLVVLSLFVSSISACACTHHLEKVEVETPSCHQDSQMEMVMENHHDANLAETLETVISDADCSCIQSTPKVIAKAENLKVEKHAAALLPKSQIEFKAVSPTILVRRIDFEPPFYLSDSFYNISPSRGPPRL